MAMGTDVSLVRINRKWTPRVRYAARRYKRAHRKAHRKFERSIRAGKSEGDAISTMCAEQASIVLELLNRLGYGGDRKKAPARDRLELEIQVHTRDEDASINFFRLFLAQREGKPLETVFSRRGRKMFQEGAEALRWQHIEELETSLKARNAAYAWLDLYYGRLELGKKYREFTRVQFDDTMDADAKAAYMALLFTQIAQRSGRTPEEVLEEFNLMVTALELNVASVELALDDVSDGGIGDLDFKDEDELEDKLEEEDEPEDELEKGDEAELED
ncbi:MAG: hypothetical protein GQ558_01310 [Thermoplasmata archaeon]|nr:hypothetical protein [Thermoplasmata archaeon]